MVEGTKYPEFARRLSEAMKESNRSVTDVKDAIGVTYEMARRYTLGTAMPRDDKMKALANFVGKSASWLAYGEESNVEPAPLQGMHRIPVVGYGWNGPFTETTDPYPVGSGSETILTEVDVGPNAFCLIIKGDSNFPEFKDGDKVVVDPAVKPIPGDMVFAKKDHELGTFKKYRPRGSDDDGNDVFELVPLNDDYPTLHSVRDGPFMIVGTMVEHRRFRRR